LHFASYTLSVHLHTVIYCTLIIDTVTENPTQILCDHYEFLLQTFDPNEITRMSYFKSLLSTDELDILLITPIGHMMNVYILEHIRILETPDLFSFLAVLQRIDSQKHICDTLLEGTVRTVCTNRGVIHIVVTLDRTRISHIMQTQWLKIKKNNFCDLSKSLDSIMIFGG